MSRSGYSDDCDGWDLIRWRGAVARALRGRRGQTCLRELAAALDAMPVKRLVANTFEQDGEVCTLGCLGRARGVSVEDLDPDDATEVASQFGIAPAMAREIMFQNDDFMTETPEQRWIRMRRWVRKQIVAD